MEGGRSASSNMEFSSISSPRRFAKVTTGRHRGISCEGDTVTSPKNVEMKSLSGSTTPFTIHSGSMPSDFKASSLINLGDLGREEGESLRASSMTETYDMVKKRGKVDFRSLFSLSKLKKRRSRAVTSNSSSIDGSPNPSSKGSLRTSEMSSTSQLSSDLGFYSPFQGTLEVDGKAAIAVDLPTMRGESPASEEQLLYIARLRDAVARLSGRSSDDSTAPIPQYHAEAIHSRDNPFPSPKQMASPSSWRARQRQLMTFDPVYEVDEDLLTDSLPSDRLHSLNSSTFRSPRATTVPSKVGGGSLEIASDGPPQVSSPRSQGGEVPSVRSGLSCSSVPTFAPHSLTSSSPPPTMPGLTNLPDHVVVHTGDTKPTISVGPFSKPQLPTLVLQPVGTNVSYVKPDLMLSSSQPQLETDEQAVATPHRHPKFDPPVASPHSLKTENFLSIPSPMSQKHRQTATPSFESEVYVLQQRPPTTRLTLPIPSRSTSHLDVGMPLRPVAAHSSVHRVASTGSMNSRGNSFIYASPSPLASLSRVPRMVSQPERYDPHFLGASSASQVAPSSGGGFLRSHTLSSNPSVTISTSSSPRSPSPFEVRRTSMPPLLLHTTPSPPPPLRPFPSPSPRPAPLRGFGASNVYSPPPGASGRSAVGPNVVVTVTAPSTDRRSYYTTTSASRGEVPSMPSDRLISRSPMPSGVEYSNTITMDHTNHGVLGQQQVFGTSTATVNASMQSPVVGASTFASATASNGRRVVFPPVYRLVKTESPQTPPPVVVSSPSLDHDFSPICRPRYEPPSVVRRHPSEISLPAAAILEVRPHNCVPIDNESPDEKRRRLKKSIAELQMKISSLDLTSLSRGRQMRQSKKIETLVCSVPHMEICPVVGFDRTTDPRGRTRG